MIQGHRGDRFGRLVLVRLARAGSHDTSEEWLCRCDCGRRRRIRFRSMRAGVTRSCGCLHRDTLTTHGHSRSREYKSWQQAKDRCFNPNHHAWRLYGGRGIRMCARWRASFAAFLADMGPRPPGMSLDRYPDGDGDYEPGNCRWATDKEQARFLLGRSPNPKAHRSVLR